MVSLLILVIVTAIIFDYINGFHDAANAIATVVSTGVLPVRTAVMLAGVLNLVGAIAGAVVAKAGVHAFKWEALKDKVLIPLVASPTLGFIVAFVLMIILV